MFSCTECDAQLQKEVDFKRHRDMHIKRERFRCLKCSFSAPYQWQLNNHLKFDHKRPVSTANPILKHDNGFKCKECEFETPDEAAMKRHAHHHTDKKINLCLHCSYSASAPWMIKEHMKTGHKSLCKEQEEFEEKVVKEKTAEEIRREKLRQEELEIKLRQQQVLQMEKQLEMAKQEMKLKEMQLNAKLKRCDQTKRAKKAKKRSRSYSSSHSSDRSLSQERKMNSKRKRRQRLPSVSSSDSSSGSSDSGSFSESHRSIGLHKSKRKKRKKDCIKSSETSTKSFHKADLLDVSIVSSDDGHRSRLRGEEPGAPIRKLVKEEEIVISSSDSNYEELETHTTVAKSVTQRKKTKQKSALRTYRPTTKRR